MTAIDSAPAAGLLTADEHRLVDTLGECYRLFKKIMGGDRQVAAEDMAEVVHHIHVLQRMVTGQAAGRAYPGLYRLLGGSLETAEE